MGIDYGRERLEVEVQGSQLISVRRQPTAAPLADPVATVRASLESPLGFPALRLALTPDDHVVIVVDEQVPRLGELLTAVLEHVRQAGVAAEAITLLCPPSASRQTWIEDLPEALEEVHLEIHDPTDRKKLSYLATTKQGRRIYLNRSAVDADQLVVLARCRYDSLLGYAGGEGAIYPALSDEETRKEMLDRHSLAIPDETAWPVRAEAAEVAWLLGAPFFVQIVEGAGDEIAHVVCGVIDSGKEARRLLDARWRQIVAQPADLVIASLSGDPTWHGFPELAQALATAARVVQSNGRIALLSQAKPALEQGAELVRQADDVSAALRLLHSERPADQAAAVQWANTAQNAGIYWLSGLPPETAEELFTTPLEHAGQVQRLLDAGESCLFLPDAHKTMAVLS